MNDDRIRTILAGATFVIAVPFMVYIFALLVLSITW